MKDYKAHNLINHDEFEDLVQALYNCEYNVSSFHRFGKTGQKQFGVDVFSFEKNMLIQCKYKGDISDKKKMLQELKNDIKDSVEKLFHEGSNWADEISKFNQLIIITTYYHDKNLQVYANQLRDKNGNKYPIEIVYEGRETFFSLIKRHYKSVKAYLPEVLNDFFTNSRINIPHYDNSSLIGRKKDIEAFKEIISRRSNLFLIHGLGGIGKTSFLRALLNTEDFLSQFQHIVYLTIFENPLQAIINQFNKLFDLFGFSQIDNLTIDENINLLIEKLNSPIGSNLLVLDNVNSLEDIKKIKEYLRDINWKVIITSRTNPQIIAQNIKLNELDENSLISIFQNHYEEDLSTNDIDIIKRILKTIEYHTLLCELIAKIARDGYVTLNEISDILNDEFIKAKDLQIEIPKGNHISLEDKNEYIKLNSYLKSIFKIVDKAFSPLELELLKFFSIIPDSYYEFDYLYDLFGLENVSKADTINIFNQLTRKGWILKQKKSFKMHSLIQDVIFQNEVPNPSSSVKLIIQARNYLSLEQDESPFDKIEILTISESILKKLEEYDDLELSVLANNISVIYNLFGKTKNAIHFSHIYLRMRENLLERNDFMLASAYGNISKLYKNINDFDNFKKFNQKFVETSKAVLDAYNETDTTELIHELDYAKLYEALADNHYSRQEYREELKYRFKCAEILERHQDVISNELINTYDKISTSYLELNLIEKALPFSIKALKYGKKRLLKTHPVYITLVNNLGNVLGNLNRDKEALSYFLEAEELNTLNYSDLFNPTFGNIYYNLALSYSKLKKYTTAKDYISKALRAFENSDPPSPLYQDALNFKNIIISYIPIRTPKEAPRNSSCPCGSGKKYKRCCGKK